MPVKSRSKSFRCLLLLFNIYFSCLTHAKCQVTSLTLQKALDIAIASSPGYHKARNAFERSQWRFKNFNAYFKPQLRLGATIPTFLRSINPIVQPDGSIQFVRVSQANNSVGLRVRQNIGFTGGVLSAGTSLQRTDNFASDKSSFFLSTPIQLSYSQNSILYNDFKWKRRVEPLIFETSEKMYTEEIENAAFDVAKMFFDALKTQEALRIATEDLSNSDTLLKIASERSRIGTVPQTDLMQLQINRLSAGSNIRQLKISYESTAGMLKNILGLPQADSLILVIPQAPPKVECKYAKAIEEARSNRSLLSKFDTERLIAEQEIARARGENSVELSVNANLGTQQSSQRLVNAYQNLQVQQYVGLTMDIPVLDWGYRKSQIRLAKANRELVEVISQQDELKFEREIYIEVLMVNESLNRLNVATEISRIAQQNFELVRQRYLLGKQTIAELNIAIRESSAAMNDQVSALANYWISMYSVRRLTLYDFIENRPIRYTN